MTGQSSEKETPCSLKKPHLQQPPNTKERVVIQSDKDSI
jgi:hypothetical protein